MELPWHIFAPFSAHRVAAVVVGLLVTIHAPAAAGQLGCSPANLTYGEVPLRQSVAFQVAVINSGRSSVTISSVSASNSNYHISTLKLPITLAGGANVSLSVTFAPTTNGYQGGRITFVSTASNSTLNLPVTGDGVDGPLALAASPKILSFGTVAVGTASTLPITLTNLAGHSVNLTGLKTTGSGFAVRGASFPLTLQGGQSVKLTAQFQPPSAGPIGGSFLITGPGLSVPMAGTGTATNAELSVSPSPLNFGSVPLGTSATRTLDLSASGQTVTLSSISSSSSQFSLSGVDLPLTVPVGKQVSVNVTFTPSKDGNAAGSLSLTSNAPGSPRSESLSGTGTAPYVVLSWMSSASENVIGYNIYRSTSSSGTQSRINSSLDPDRTYTDSNVTAGDTYYYSTTSVNSSGKESAHSEQVEVQIP